MISMYRWSNLSTRMLMISIGLLFTVLVGCTGVTIKDDLLPSVQKGYADFGNYSLGSAYIYSMQDGKRVQEGSLTYKGDILRIARTPGNHEFLIEHWAANRHRTEKMVTVSIMQDRLTFITIDQLTADVEDIKDGRYETTLIHYRTAITQARTPAPLSIESEPDKNSILDKLLGDPDRRARLYGIGVLEKMGRSSEESLVKRVEVLAVDDPQRSVRRQAAAFLKSLGIDAFKDIRYLENFEFNNRTWISSHGIYDFFYNDEFLFRSAGDGCETEKITTPFELTENATIELTSTWISGRDSGEYGVLIGSNENNFDHFGISRDGRAVVRAVRNSELSGDLLPWTAVSAIKTQGVSPNRLKVEIKGDLWKYYVNDAYIGTIENTMKGAKYLVGLRGCLKQTIAFEQLKVSKLREN